MPTRRRASPPAGAADPADTFPYPLVVQDRDLRTLLEIKPPGEGEPPGGELAAVPATAAGEEGGIIVPTVRLLDDAQQPDNLVREQDPPVVQRMQDSEQPDVVGQSAAAQAASAAWRSAERAVALDPPYIRYVQVGVGRGLLCCCGLAGRQGSTLGAGGATSGQLLTRSAPPAPCSPRPTTWIWLWSMTWMRRTRSGWRSSTQRCARVCTARQQGHSAGAAVGPSLQPLPLHRRSSLPACRVLVQARRAKSRKGRRTLGEEWMEHLIDRMEKEYTTELQVGWQAGRCCEGLGRCRQPRPRLCPDHRPSRPSRCAAAPRQVGGAGRRPRRH